MLADDANKLAQAIKSRDGIDDCALSELHQYFDLSVRLRNCLAVATNKELNFPRTIGDYINGGKRARAQLLKLPNFGKKCADELDACINQLALCDPQALARKDELTASAKMLATKVQQALAALPFPEALEHLDLSTRLKNCIVAFVRNADVHSSIWDLMSYRSGLRARLDGAWSMGRQTRSELSNHLRNVASSQLKTAGLDRKAAMVISDLLTKGDIYDDAELSVAIASRADDIFTPHHDVAELQQPSSSEASPDSAFHTNTIEILQGADLQNVVQEQVQKLKGREVEIILLRYGFDERGVHTLQEIGDIFQVSRERIRQIEKKAFGRLRKRTLKPVFYRIVEIEADKSWRTLAEANGGILCDTLTAKFKLLSPEVRLAIDVAFGSPDKWLDDIGQKAPLGWFRGQETASTVKSNISEAIAHLKDTGGVFLIEVLADHFGIDAESLRLADVFHSRVTLKEGYIWFGSLTTRRLRAVNAHRLIYCGLPYAYFDLRRLYYLYRRTFADDLCSYRDLIISFETNKNLFLRIFEDQWTALPVRPDVRALPPASGLNEIAGQVSEDELQLPSADGRIAQMRIFIRQLLNSMGPTSLNDIEDACAEAGSEWAINSILPIMLTSAEFVRFAPGVWGLAGQLAEFAQNDRSIPSMETSRSARLYAMAVKAGERRDWYPGWHVEREINLVKKASKILAQDEYESFMSIINPDRWIIKEAEKLHWTNEARREGKYSLDRPQKFRISECGIRLDRILACATYAWANKRISWMSINRICGRRIDYYGAVCVLGLLIGLRSVSPALHWQDNHVLQEDADWTIFSKLSSHLSSTGELPWQNGTLRSLLTSAIECVPEVGFSWVDLTDLRKRLHDPDEGAQIYGRTAFASDGADADGADEDILASLVKASEADDQERKVDDALRSLLSVDSGAA